MTCPDCGAKAKIIDSRFKNDSTRRRYKCLGETEHRWTTIEIFACSERYRGGATSLKNAVEKRMSDNGRRELSKELASLLGIN